MTSLRDPLGRLWLAVYTKPMLELLAVEDINNAGFATLWMRFPAQAKHARRTYDTLRSRYPRYLFVAVDEPGEARQFDDRSAPVSKRISCVVTFGGHVEWCPPRVIETLRKRCVTDDGLMEPPAFQEADNGRKLFQPQERVKIGNGPFRGYTAAVDTDRGNAVDIWMDFFNRRFKMSFDPTEVEAT